MPGPVSGPLPLWPSAPRAGRGQVGPGIEVLMEEATGRHGDSSRPGFGRASRPQDGTEGDEPDAPREGRRARPVSGAGVAQRRLDALSRSMAARASRSAAVPLCLSRIFSSSFLVFS